MSKQARTPCAISTATTTSSVAGDGAARLIPEGVRRLAGAAVFLGLVAAMGVWSWRLGTRDAAEVPIIRAMEGPARVEPEDPGGLQAAHQGLEVNAVLAGRPAPVPRDRRRPRPAPRGADRRGRAAGRAGAGRAGGRWPSGCSSEAGELPMPPPEDAARARPPRRRAAGGGAPGRGRRRRGRGRRAAPARRAAADEPAGEPRRRARQGRAGRRAGEPKPAAAAAAPAAREVSARARARGWCSSAPSTARR